MVENNIGKQITELRKRDKITQEQLGAALGVSGQAVSKWESGRCPDIGLIPAIADYFNVTIDSLFGVDSSDKFDIGSMIVRYLHTLKFDDRFQEAMRLCWNIVNGILPAISSEGRFEDMAEFNSGEGSIAYISAEKGIVQMSVSRKEPSFFFLPEPDAGYRSLLDSVDKEDYLEFFRCMACRDFFDAVLFVMTLENESYFTKESLMNDCSISKERIFEILDVLKKYRLITEKKLRIDGKCITIYSGEKKVHYSELLGIFLFTRSIMKPKCYYCKFFEGRSRPYLDDIYLEKGENSDEICPASDEDL